jgi:hypothetical protein
MGSENSWGELGLNDCELAVGPRVTRTDLKAGKQVVGCAHSLQCARFTPRSPSPSATRNAKITNLFDMDHFSVNLFTS